MPSSDASTSKSWETILDDCCVDRPKESPTFRVVVCGDVHSGKRSWVLRLKESLGVNERAGLHGAGVDYSSVDVKRPDGNVSHTVEFFCVDVPDLLDVALPDTKTLSRSVIVFTCDVSAPVQGVDSISRWTSMVNKQVATLAGEDTCNALRRARLALCATNRTAYAASEPEPNYVNPANKTDREILAITTVCALPCVVLATKLDLLDTLPNSKILLAKPDEETTVLGLVRDIIRVASIEVGSDLVFTHSADSGGNKLQEQFNRALIAHLASLASAPGGPYPSIEKFVVGYDLAPFKMFPCGLDTSRSMAQQITLHDVQLQYIFPSELRSPGRRSSEASRYESHQQLLSLSWNAASPGHRGVAASSAVHTSAAGGGGEGELDDWLDAPLDER